MKSPAPPAPATGALRLTWRVAGFPLRRVAPAVGAGMLSAACGIGLLATSGWLITRASQRPPVFALSIAVGAVQAFALGRGLARYLQRLAVHRGALAALGRLRLWLFDVVEPLAPGGLPGRGSGGLLSAFVADSDLVAQAVARQATAGIDVAASVVLGAALAASLVPAAGVLLLAGSAATVTLALLAARLSRAGDEQAGRAREQLAEAVLETMRAVPELAVYGRADLLHGQLDAVRRRSTAAALRQARAAGAGRAVAAWAGGASLIAVTAAALRTAAQGRVGGLTVAVLVFVALAVLDQCAGLPSALAGTGSGHGAARRLAGLARLRPVVREPAADPPLPGRPITAALRDVEVPAGPGPVGVPLLQGVSLQVAPGRRVALTGPSGSGKSSLILTLLHLLEASRGEVRLGQTEVRRLTRAGLAGYLGWVGDHTHLFAASLGDNLRLGDPRADDAACAAALGQVGLGPWFRSLPDGLATRLGSGGRPVSAGERQRLGMARVLLAGTDLLLLDEPTAHLDPASTPGVLRELLDSAGPRSVLLVGHDPQIFAGFDDVVTLEAGRVVDG